MAYRSLVDHRNCTRVDFTRLSDSQSKLFDKLRDSATRPITFSADEDFQSLEIALKAGVRSISYDTAYFDPDPDYVGYDSCYFDLPIDEAHARALGQVLAGARLFELEIEIVGWNPGAFEAFLEELEKESPLVEHLNFNFSKDPKDEINSTDAAQVSALVPIFGCQVLRVTCDWEVQPDFVQTLSREMSDPKVSTLKLIQLRPNQNDPRERDYPPQFPELQRWASTPAVPEANRISTDDTGFLEIKHILRDCHLLQHVEFYVDYFLATRRLNAQQTAQLAELRKGPQFKYTPSPSVDLIGFIEGTKNIKSPTELAQLESRLRAQGSGQYYSAQTRQQLETALKAGVRSMSYLAGALMGQYGSHDYWWIEPEMARVIGRSLAGAQLFHFQLKVTGWAPGAFDIFIRELVNNPPTIEHLCLSQIIFSGTAAEAFNPEIAKRMPDLIRLCRSQTVILWNDWYSKEALQAFAFALNSEKSSPLKLVRLMSNDRRPAPKDIPAYSELEKWSTISPSSTRIPINNADFQIVMNLVKALFNDRSEYGSKRVSAVYCDYFLATLDLNPANTKWLENYRERCGKHHYYSFP